MPKISLVMPVYKTEKFLARAIESILDQDVQDWELICVCDGYSKKATEIIRSFKDDRIKDLTIAHGGACKARNAGAKISTGKYLSFFSSDFQAVPGMLRTWLRTFEDHPEFKFIYGGYLFPDKSAYGSEPFDAWLLESYNFIDGGFPMERELWEKYPWDERVHSLNDWDFWLRIVKAGYKGYFMDGYYSYIAEFPRVGGLSDDSTRNWMERVKLVKENNGLKLRDIVVASLGAPFFGKNVAKMLEADFKPMPSHKKHAYKLIYLLGFYVSNAKAHAEVFQNAPQGCKKVIHWLGSDILQMMQLKFFEMKELVKSLNNQTIQFCESEAKQKELAEMGIKAEVMPVLRDISKFDIKPLPKDFAVAVYLPDVNTGLYNPVLMENIVKNMPDVKFCFFGDRRITDPEEFKKQPQPYKNVEIMGYTDVNKVIEKASVLLRFTSHDGLPTGPMEFLMSGRFVITNVEMPHVIRVDGVVDSEGVRKDIISKIRTLRKEIKEGKQPSLEAAAYYKDYLNPDKIRERLYKLANE